MGKRHSYTEEFKREALARAEAVGPTKACEELEITPSLIYQWKKKYSTPFDSKKTQKPTYEDLEKENRRLKKELGYMEEINKVLKKSTAIFSSDQIKK